MKRAWHKVLFAAALVVWCGYTGSVTAQEPIVRAGVSEQGALWAGQQVTLRVELLVPGYFASAAGFELPDPDGVLLMPPAGHPVVGNETIDATLYTSQLHELRAWPMRAGQQFIPAVTARFQYKRHPLDTEAVSGELTTQAVALEVRLPPGAEQLGNVFSARQLSVEETWEPEPGSDPVQAGAAYTRTITFSAPGVPGMVFPPFPAGDIDGLGIYSKRQLLDRDERGELTGVRRDRITYVLQRPGQFTVPATRYTWFDLDARQLRSETLPARTFSVIANPDLASAQPSGSGEGGAVLRDPRWWYAVLAGATVAALATLVLRSRRMRAGLRRALAPLRPVHLQPLNPADKSNRNTAGKTDRA